MKDLWPFMKMKLNPADLPTMREVLNRLQDNEANMAIERLQDEQMERYHNTLLWRYPLSQDSSVGGFILPVREGILWIPYGKTSTYEGDLLITGRRLEHGEGGSMLELGSFEVISGKLAVSDPCYDTDVWCRGELENCKTGTWAASALEKHMGMWRHRICKLIAVHEDYVNSASVHMERAPFEVGVDSGQAGIFDAAHYRDPSVIPDDGHKHLFEGEEAEPWYVYCCDITLRDQSAGVLPFGCVSSSGFGDGGYDCFFWRNSEGQIVRVEIEYLPEDEEEDEE